MAQGRLKMAIERMERALARLEAVDFTRSQSAAGNPELAQRHEALKTETRAAIGEIDRLLAGMES